MCSIAESRSSASRPHSNNNVSNGDSLLESRKSKLVVLHVSKLWSRAIYLGESDYHHYYYLYDRGYTITSDVDVGQEMPLSVMSIECPCIRVELTGNALKLAECLRDATKDNSALNLSRWHASLFINNKHDFFRTLATQDGDHRYLRCQVKRTESKFTVGEINRRNLF